MVLYRSMWKIAGQPSIGRSAWFILVARQMLRRIASFAYERLRIRPKVASRQGIHESELKNRA